ncbi:MAG: short-chain dehydrogenase/reductase SDR [Candidatus Peregrinibacteria bacterium Greene0416_19]|nr:MAG: short-chain dehydrogenase/reductase SDR [Candidatus Peregrinibacteria bacterium Greene0416_19]
MTRMVGWCAGMPEQKTILVTGTSTGIGHAAAIHFAERGWNVLAGSRHPEKLHFIQERITPIGIDVNSIESVDRCFADERVKKIDCLVNNAGYGLLLPFEDTPPEEIERMFRTNVFGLMEVSRRAAKLFREKRAGTIINISSVLGRIGAPWYSVYCASKFAVEGFSESLSHELRPFGVHVKIVEPSGTQTGFHHIAYDTEKFPITQDYRARYETKRNDHDRGVNRYDTPESVAAVIWQAATDGAWKLRYPLRQAKQAALARRLLGEEGLWRKLLKKFGSL